MIFIEKILIEFVLLIIFIILAFMIYIIEKTSKHDKK